MSAKLHGFFEDPKITVLSLMLSWRETLSDTSVAPSHWRMAHSRVRHAGLLQVATVGGEQVLRHLPGHWRAAAVPTQTSVGVNLVSRAGSHLGYQVVREAAKCLLLCCLCLCPSHGEVR